MKIQLIQDILAKKRSMNEAALLLSVSRQTLSRWKSLYFIHGEKGLVPKKP
jgi:transposase-like protein